MAERSTRNAKRPGLRSTLPLLLLILAVAVEPVPLGAQTALGELEGRPAPVSRRQCVGGANAGSLCNENADCPGSTCQVANIFNVSVAVRFDATAAELAQIRTQFEAGSELLFDVTDGQAQFGQVSIYNNSTGNRGHYWVTETGGCSAATGDWGVGGRINISMTALNGASGPGCVAHEFLHLAFDTRDEYESRQAGCGALAGSANCPDTSQGTNSAAAEACLMECCGRIGSEICWGQAAGDNLAAGNHDATNVTEQSRCRSDRSCWEQVGWSWPNTVQVPVGAPDPGSAGQVHKPLVFLEPPADARLVMVLDRSGSMSLDTPTRLQRLQTAALDVVDLAEAGVELGIVSFSNSATDDKAIDALGANRSTWTTPINNLVATGATNIGDGLQHAWDQIVAAGGATANTGIILMTDGVNNQPLGNAAADLQSKINLLLANGVPVWVTCTGDDLGLDSQCSEIATGTNGSYVDSADAARLPERFVSFYEQIVGRVPAMNAAGSMVEAAEKRLVILVEEGARLATFTLQWADPQIEELEALLIDPSGREYPMKSMRQGLYLRVKEPEPGEWRARLKLRDNLPPDARWVFNGFIDNPKVGATGTLRRRLIQPGEAFEVCSRPIYEVPLAGLEITGRVQTPSGKEIPFALYDDGGLERDTGDEVPGDGKYCNRFSETGERGAYSFGFRVVARDAQPGDDREPGIEYKEPRLVDFERWIEFSGTVDDRELALDDFKCYQARPARRTLMRRREVTLEDQFGASEALVHGPVALCGAVSKNGEGMRDRGAHLECYKIEERAEPREREVVVSNQFGTEPLVVFGARTLCVPTIKNREKSRLAFEHFKCYDARPRKEPRPRSLTLQDQFAKVRSVAQGPVSLCTPVSKNREGVEDSTTHLTCYRITDRAFGESYRGRRVQTENQFGREELMLYEESLLCVPSTKELVQ